MFTAIYGGGFLNPPPPFYTLLASVLVWPVLSNSRKVNTTFIFMKFMLMLCVSGSQPRLACQQLPAKTNTSQISHNSLPPASSMHTISACPVYQPIKLQWSLNLALASNFFCSISGQGLLQNSIIWNKTYLACYLTACALLVVPLVSEIQRTDLKRKLFTLIQHIYSDKCVALHS